MGIAELVDEDFPLAAGGVCVLEGNSLVFLDKASQIVVLGVVVFFAWMGLWLRRPSAFQVQTLILGRSPGRMPLLGVMCLLSLGILAAAEAFPRVVRVAG